MRYIVIPDNTQAYIHPEVYGNFSEHLGRCIYNGVFVGKDSPIPNVNGMRTDVVAALKAIHLPVLRWPGGCFADEYHWKDGVGPLSTRKKMINANWGSVVEDNSFGTHEFLELCRQIGCEAYINGNVGSGTVHEMQEWIEYMTNPGTSPMADMRRANGQDAPWAIKYFAVGNENWGCGGNMRAEFYADQYRRYQTFIRNYGDQRVYKIACGAGTSPSNPNYAWTETLMREAGNLFDGLSLHYYTLATEDWDAKGSATDFTREEYLAVIKNANFIETLLRGHGAIMDRYDPEKTKGLIVDEWGTWFDVEPGTNPGFLYQQNTMRDAIVAALTLNAFNHHADRVQMANIAQLINVLQAVILTDGAEMLRTPTYHVFDLFRVHQGAHLVQSAIVNEALPIPGSRIDAVSESASVDAAGRVSVTMANASPDKAIPIDMTIDGRVLTLETARILTGEMHEHNTFDKKEAVCIHPLEGVRVAKNGGSTDVAFSLPPVSVVQLTLA